MDGFGCHFGEDAVFEEFTESLRGLGIDADVLVHVECIDAVPFNFMREQRSKEFVLGGGGGENDIDFVLPGEKLFDVRCDLFRCDFSQLGSRVGHFYFQTPFCKFSYHG